MRDSTIKIVSLTVLLGLALSCGGGGGSIQPPPKGATSYYVDCSAATNGDGTQDSPWNALSSTNVISFGPGDQLLLKRGTTCQGALSPVGSGSSDATIVIDSYGTGAQPIIDGGTSNAAISLTDQQYWEIRNLEIVGGNKFGVFISGNTPKSSLNHFHLINLNVHGAHYPSTNTRDSGEVFISPAGVHQIVNDVLLDGVSAHDTQVSEGIVAIVRLPSPPPIYRLLSVSYRHILISYNSILQRRVRRGFCPVFLLADYVYTRWYPVGYSCARSQKRQVGRRACLH